VENKRYRVSLRYLFCLQRHLICLIYFKSQKKPERRLNRASDLKKGDMFTVIDSFAYPSWLKGQTLRVIDVQTYQYQHSRDTEFVLEN
jgi:hypothetical protein